jgi:hypothetical protein
MAKIEVTLEGKLADGRDTIEGPTTQSSCAITASSSSRGNIDRDPVAPGQGRPFPDHRPSMGRGMNRKNGTFSGTGYRPGLSNGTGSDTLSGG